MNVKGSLPSSWKKKTDYLETFGEQGEIPDDFTENAREKEQRELILEAVFGLPRKYRMPVYLYYYEEYSVAEIAGILGAKSFYHSDTA